MGQKKNFNYPITRLLNYPIAILKLGALMNRKVTVVGGAGNVGATVARAIAVKELADVVIVDIAAEKAAGIALDIFQACPIDGSDSRLIGTTDYAATANSDVVVITSGVPVSRA